MKTILLKTLVNFMMIETVLVLTSVNLAVSLPIQVQGGFVQAAIFIYMVLGVLSLLPALLASFLFAYVEKKK